MTESEARDWIATTFDVPRETMALLDAYVARLLAAADSQNLLSRGSIPHVWERHIRDSAQLLLHAGGGRWADIGAGPGLPGLVLAILGEAVTLIEPRRLRAAFLAETVESLGLGARTRVIAGPVERFADAPFDIITARAFAPLVKLFPMVRHLAGPQTIWLLPKGRSAQEEVAAARAAWQGDFDIAPSATDSEAGIVIARNVEPRRKR